MGTQHVPGPSPDYIPVVMAYPAEGYQIDEIEELCKALKAFANETKDQYKGKQVRLYLLPQDQVDMLSQVKEG